ncbi:hypothetical protein [Sulfurimonas paralvinellae]|uniref:Uncharacterized protein n=1 Tax=Sulfurimonas paralvinellae TaxID=317658 RepID=A0A7M1BAR8_9BACT|nr:hypothetical protein [Sulfurimonas paralvinellae]QOP46810.1 hypothetical protein FM071_10565 [Sulfurimonas paralvinellae]
MIKDKELDRLKEILKAYLVEEGYTEINDPFATDMIIDASGALQSSGEYTIRTTAQNADGATVAFRLVPYEMSIYCENELVKRIEEN